MDAEGYESQVSNAKGPCAFMWGGIRNALLLECKQGNMTLIRTLCATANTSVKEMMVLVLRDYGTECQDDVEKFLLDLLEPEPVGLLKSIRRMREPVTPLDIRLINSKRIATEVASHLGLVTVLIRAIQDGSENVRSQAVRYTYYLWLENAESGMKVLDAIAARSVLQIGIPFIPVLVCGLQLSLLILMRLQENPGAQETGFTRTALQLVWRKILGRLFGSNNLISKWMRVRILDVAISRIVSMTRELPRYNASNLDEIDYFVKNVGDEDHESFRRLLTFLTPDVVNLANAMPDLVKAVKRNDTVSSYVMGQILILQGRVQKEATLDTIRGLWQVAMSMDKPGLTTGQIPFVLYVIQRQRQQFDSETTGLMRKFGSEFLDRTISDPSQINTKGGIGYSPIHSYSCFFLNILAMCEYELKRNEGANALTLKYIGLGMTANATTFLRDIVWFMGNLAYQPKYHRALLANLKPIFKYSIDQVQKHPQDNVVKDLYDDLVNLLARARYVHTEDVDEFLTAEGYPDQYVNHVLSAETNESIGGDIIWSRATSGFGDMFISLLDSPALRPRLVTVLNRLSTTKSLRKWMSYTARIVVNTVYGDDIYKTN